MSKTNEIMEDFISRPLGFFDTSDGLDWMKQALATKDQEKVDVVRAIHAEVIDTIDFYEKRSGSVITPVFTDVNEDIRNNAAKYGVTLDTNN